MLWTESSAYVKERLKLMIDLIFGVALRYKVMPILV